MNGVNIHTDEPPRPDPATLREIEQRVLWLATRIIDHANRRDETDIKVGGHQASCASMVSIMTALWFAHIGGDDKVAVKPHASPVYHAIKYLTGELDRSYLTTLRQRGGLQAYPSRTKDPDVSDFSTGSVGLGAVAPLFSALTRRYTDSHFGPARSGTLHRARRRRRTRRGQRVGSDRRPGHSGSRQLHDGHRPQPPIPRPSHPRHRRHAPQALLRRRRLARRRSEVRPPTRRQRSR